MWVDEACHIEMATVSSPTQSVLWRSPTKDFLADVVQEMLTEIWEQAKQYLHLENAGMWTSDLISGLPVDRVRLTDRLEEAAEQLWVVQEEHQEANTEEKSH
jgi:DNA-directed RNA polymerase specialized sigma24 family protein